MKEEDLTPLRTPFGAGDERRLEDRLPDALGIRVPSVRTLVSELYGDLDPVRGGFGWWDPHPGKARRILISDCVVATAQSIEQNLVEAVLHRLELEDYERQHEHLLERGVQFDDAGTPSIVRQWRHCPADYLPPAFSDLHIAGLVRALISAIDCASVVVVGVLGLSIPILFADWLKVRVHLTKLASGTPSGSRVQRESAQVLLRLEQESGPPGWLRWFTDLRNMYVHRGRRLSQMRLSSTMSYLYTADRSRPRSLRAIPLLPRHPGLSEVEAMLHTRRPLVLDEDGRKILEAGIAATTTFTETVTARCLELWRERRLNPQLVVQPKAQWPKDPRDPEEEFVGFSPVIDMARPEAMETSLGLGTRMKAAHLFDHQRNAWKDFD